MEIAVQSAKARSDDRQALFGTLNITGFAKLAQTRELSSAILSVNVCDVGAPFF